VIVPDDQLSLAIGQRGQNARLAAKLTGWKVDIKGESEDPVSMNGLFKPEDSDKTDAQASGSQEESLDQSLQEQKTADVPDSTEVEQVVDLAEDVEGDSDADAVETEGGRESRRGN
jgi:transcription antitermination factor NusA-like protein